MEDQSEPDEFRSSAEIATAATRKKRTVRRLERLVAVSCEVGVELI